MVWFLNGENGRKIEKRPNLSAYDNMRPKPERAVAQDVALTGGYNQALVKDAPRTHGRDRALLVALGVDGDVPLAQAVKNAGLALFDFAATRGKVTMRHAIRSANDNHEIAAKAA